MVRVPFAGEAPAIEIGQIRDVSLTTRVTQRTMLHQVMTTRAAAVSKGAAGTSHETVQASPKLGTSEQHPQRATVPLHEQREHRHPQDVRELSTQRIKAKPAERPDERSDIEEETNRRDAGTLFA